jgi:hypothetical protein
MAPVLAVDNTAMTRFGSLQAQESLAVHVLARELVDRVLCQSWEDADRRIQAKARYQATHAIRCMHDGWEAEGLHKAKDAVVRCLRDECGAAFAGILTEQHYEVLASLLAHAAVGSYRGVTEGSSPITPGDYLRISEGR